MIDSLFYIYSIGWLLMVISLCALCWTVVILMWRGQIR